MGYRPNLLEGIIPSNSLPPKDFSYLTALAHEADRFLGKQKNGSGFSPFPFKTIFFSSRLFQIEFYN